MYVVLQGARFAEHAQRNGGTALYRPGGELGSGWVAQFPIK